MKKDSTPYPMPYETDQGMFTIPEIHAMNPSITKQLIRYRLQKGIKSIDELIVPPKLHIHGNNCTEINALLALGWTRKAIAKKVGCTQWTLLQWGVNGLPKSLTKASLRLQSLLNPCKEITPEKHK